MTPNAQIVSRLIIAAGLGSAPESSAAWPVYVSFLPAEIDNAVAVWDTGGTLDGRIMRTGNKVNHPGIQIRVRGPVYPTTFAKIQAIAESLDSVYNDTVSVNGIDYQVQNLSRTSDILPMGLEEGDRKRYHFTVNAILTVKQV